MTDIKFASPEELQRMVTVYVDQRMITWLDKLHSDSEAFGMFDPPDTRTPEEIWASIDQNMLPLPGGVKSVVDLLREDRDR